MSLSSKCGFVGLAVNNLRMIKTDVDIVFMAYIYESSLLLLALLKHLGICHRKIIVISHNTLNSGRNFIERLLFRMVYSTIDMILFHSKKNMDESVNFGLVKSNHAQHFYWGDDLEFVDRMYSPSVNKFFISTGRENRDYEILIEAFVNPKSCLELYTNETNNENDYRYLQSKIGKYPNISIEYVDNSSMTTRRLAQRTARCCCVMIPLLHEQVNYCVGLTSMVEAMAMGKPIISSSNPYSPIDLEKEGIGIYANSVEEWKKAVLFFEQNPDKIKEMGKRARQLAENWFNINETASLLEKEFSS